MRKQPQSLIGLWLAGVVVFAQPAWGKERVKPIGQIQRVSEVDKTTTSTQRSNAPTEPALGDAKNQQSRLATNSGLVKPITDIRRVSEIERPARSAKMLVQSPTPQATPSSPVVQVSFVKANPTNRGLELVLQTSKAATLQLQNRTQVNSNTFIVDIPNAQLRAPGDRPFTFRSQKPIAGVTEITVTNFDANTIRVTVIGEASAPTVELYDSPKEGLIFSVSTAASIAQNSTPNQRQGQGSQQPQTQTQPTQPSAQGDEPIELVVTGEQDGYSASDATTATKTDTPLRDIPQSIQVIPQTVIKDQQITRITDAVSNVSGVTVQRDLDQSVDSYNIRGFTTQNFLIDGFYFPAYGSLDLSPYSIERVEVLKGPGSVLYGQLEPGGIVNYVTKKPLSEPYYSGEFVIGNYDFYNPSIDISGPLTEDKRLLYRLNAAYQSTGSFVDFVNGESFSISPTLTYKIGDATTLNLRYNYSNTDYLTYSGLPADPKSFNAPINRFLGEPNSDSKVHSENHLINLNFTHRFNKHLEFRSSFTTQLTNSNNPGIFRVRGLQDDGRTVNRDFAVDISDIEIYSLQNNFIADFNTGSIQHKLLFGVDWTKLNALQPGLRAGQAETPLSPGAVVAPIDLFNPIYGAPAPTVFDGFSGVDNAISGTFVETSAIYLQDQVTLLPNLKLLLGGRYDFVNNASTRQPIDQNFNTLGASTRDESYSEAFSPRIGIVYQPIEPLSLYASYSQSFVPNTGRNRNGGVFEPSRGTQYEAGIRAELLDRRLIANLAAYEITKTNVLTSDAQDQNFQIATGEVTSRGIEFDLAGKILPGWNIIASLFHNDAFVSKDESIPKGDRLTGAPRQGGSLWTTYEIQSGNLQGFGFGAGVFFAGSRDVVLPNTFKIPSYGRFDAAVFYRRDNWRVGINFKNLLDTKYYESTTFGDIRPAAPFTVLGTVSISF
ncbi:TonB-dependent siderophore receptor [Brasilonema octagenarum UFV-E1]|uniref:TonB-dependent siderophore receptor n=1 Tax=Brasilonema sennae CENA114 TaxID=415709 RepID=A0A856ME46_9CYAN|nr:TonB-dependent siderophore receptor [Brasilonema sennae]QDL07961.1 TonB-dependent siderophore receptor [Brasilonema sennae CENA114]QDL14321.1 TonB-dependent siderophore receptor [Brasilonema octagenarum UFV-E1]